MMPFLTYSHDYIILVNVYIIKIKPKLSTFQYFQYFDFKGGGGITFDSTLLFSNMEMNRVSIFVC